MFLLLFNWGQEKVKHPRIPHLRGQKGGGVCELCDLSERSEAGGELISARYKPLKNV